MKPHFSAKQMPGSFIGARGVECCKDSCMTLKNDLQSLSVRLQRHLVNNRNNDENAI